MRTNTMTNGLSFNESLAEHRAYAAALTGQT